MRQISIWVLGLLCPLLAMAGRVTSPNGKLTAVTNGTTLTVSYQRQQVLEVADACADGQSLAFVRKVKDDYQMLSGKRLHCTNEANEYRCGNMLLRMYNDGIAFRYANGQANANSPAYRIPEGREAFVTYFSKEFPHEAEHIHDYVDALFELAEEVYLFWMRRGSDALFSHSERFLWSADELIAHYIQDERLRDILAYMNPMYGGVKGHTPAYIHALINVLYITGPSRFVGGSQQLADALATVIREHGGEVITDAEVVRIVVDDHQATAIELSNNGTVINDFTQVVSAIHPAALLPLCTTGAFPKSR